MAGISDKTAGGLENKYKYNGIELDTLLGLDEYEASLRDLDPQTGRWWQVDPETEDQEMWSPYTSNYDNPIRYVDPKGDEGDDCCGGFLHALADAGDKILISAGGVLFGSLNTISGGVIPSDPFHESTLPGEAGMYFRNGNMVGKLAPYLPVGPVPEPINIKPVPVDAPISPKVDPAASKSVEGLISNTKQSSSNSNTSTSSSRYKEPPRHSSLIKKVVQNASKPGVKLSDAKINQLKRVVNESGGSVRTEVGQQGSVKGIKHSQVEGYGPSTAHRHIIHSNQN